MADDKIVRPTISIYESQAKTINRYLNHHKELNVSKFFRKLIDEFFNRDKKTILKDFLIYVGYPFTIIFLLILYSRAVENIYIFWTSGIFFSLFMYSLYTFFKRLRER
jgi:hypothetical protein